MTQEEINNFNKFCAEFLGYKILGKPYKGAITTQEGCNNPSFLHERIEGESWYVYPNFHSDWNWIMEVVEAIEKLNENRYYVSILESECSIIDKQAAENEENPFMIEPVTACLEANSKKEAVVQAINQFLIWYNNENNK